MRIETDVVSTARNGKIARLPRHVRDELNRRLDDGHEAKSLLPWLNSLPEVQAVLAAQFDSQPISEMNLSRWKQGGFLEWQQLQEKSARLERFFENAAAMPAAPGPAPTAEILAQLLSADLALAAADLLAANPELQDRWQRLREILPELSRLRRDECRVHAVNLARRRADRLDAEARSRQAEADTRAALLSAAQDHLISDLFASPDPSLKALAVSLSETLLARDTAAPPVPPRVTGVPPVPLNPNPSSLLDPSPSQRLITPHNAP